VQVGVREGLGAVALPAGLLPAGLQGVTAAPQAAVDPAVEGEGRKPGCH
jgi:hypothetical protein